MAFTKLPNNMKHIFALLLLTGAVASAQLVSIPLLNGPIVYSNSVSALTILPTTVGKVGHTYDLYYTNFLSQVVVPNGTSNLVAGVPTASGKTWPTALPASSAWSQKAAANPVLSVVVARENTSNSIAFTLSRSYDGVYFTPLGAAAPLNTNYSFTLAAVMSATSVASNYSLTLPPDALSGVQAVRLESVVLGAGSNGIVRILDARLNGNQ